ncbi:MAG: choice-of-anchor D domain-containing protein, partial [Lentisphaeria bacterium]|nr:choice-of-anchor D domain-containing protein [Lentisphaeria bacterium]
FRITGRVLSYPEIEVRGNGIVIGDGDTTPSPSDDTDFGDVDLSSGAPVTHTFTIVNTGQQALNLTASPRVAIGGTHAGDFSLVQDASTPVASGGGTTTFQIQFTPSALGDRDGTVSIANDDTDENPYTFALRGTGTEPDIDVTGTTDFGDVDVTAGSVEHTFSVINTGNGDLSIGGITLAGAHPGDFSITQVLTPASPVPAGGNATFKVTFDPSALGLRTADLNIASDDPDEDPYLLALQGTGVEPEMDVRGGSPMTSIVDGDTSPDPADGTAFGSVSTSAPGVTHLYQIHNTGTGMLNLTGSPPVQITSMGFSSSKRGDAKIMVITSGWAVSAQPGATSIFPGGFTTFQITFDPDAPGTEQAAVTIPNDDSDEDPYNFVVEGTGTEPDISVTGLGILIPDGDTTPSVTDDTDYRGVPVGGSLQHTFTIHNTGNATLTLVSRGLYGAYGHWAFGPTGSWSVPPGGTTTGSVLFTPQSPGLHTVIHDIESNDPDTAVYDFVLQGVGTAPPVMDAEPATTCGTDNTVSWSAVAEADEYEVQASTDPAFGGTPLSSGWQAGVSYLFSGLPAAEVVYFRARCRFHDVTPPVDSDWSASVSSFQAGTPVLLAVDPVSGYNSGATPVTLTGEDLWGATGAQLETGPATPLTGTPVVSADGTTVTGLSVPAGIAAGTYGITVSAPCGDSTVPDAFTVIPQVTLTVRSDPEISVPIGGTAPGITPYDVLLTPPADVTLVAPYMHADQFFLRWKDADNVTLSYPPTLDLTVAAPTTVLAEYGPVTDFYVAEDGDDANPGTSPAAPMRNIQALLDRYPGIGTPCVVHVGPGTYAENVTIDLGHEGLTIRGAGDGADPAADTHVLGQGGPMNTHVFRVLAGAGPGGEPTTVEWLRVSSPAGSGVAAGPGAMPYGGVTVEAPYPLAKGDPGMVIDGVLLRCLTITEVTGEGLGCGILLQAMNPWSDMVRNVAIEGCHILANGGPGIMLVNTQVAGLEIRGGPCGRTTVIAHNGGSGLLLNGTPTPDKGPCQFEPFALHDTIFWDNAPYNIELVETDCDIDAMNNVAFVGCGCLEDIEETVWHEMDDGVLGLVLFGMPDISGNCLTWDPAACLMTFGGNMLPSGTGWYGLSYPAGAQ